WCDLLAGQRGAGLGGFGGVDAEALLQGVVGHGPAAAGDKERVAGCPGALGEPGAQRGDRAGSERRDPVFSAFAVAGDVGAIAEVNVPAGQGGEFGSAQPGLDREQDPGVVAAPGAGGAVGGRQQGAGFGVGEEGDDRLVAAFGRDGQDPFDVGGVFGGGQRRIGGQGVDGCQQCVATAGAVAPLVLEAVDGAAA